MPSSSRNAIDVYLAKLSFQLFGSRDLNLTCTAPRLSSCEKNNAKHTQKRKGKAQNRQGRRLVCIILTCLVQINREGINTKELSQCKFAHRGRKGQERCTDHARPDIRDD